MRARRTWIVGFALAATACSAAYADPWDRPRRDCPPRPTRLASGFDGYAIVKGGGMLLGGGSSSSGGWFGLEVGRTAGDWLDLGISLDVFHRRSRDTELLFETDRGFDPPLRAEVTTYESSTDFVPLGFTARFRMPIANDVVTPFVSGTLAWEVLHLSFFERDPMPRPWDALLGDSQTLFGLGWQAAAGVEARVAPQVAIFGEAGVHWSDPARRLEDVQGPVDVRAELHGAFLRTGLRVGL